MKRSAGLGAQPRIISVAQLARLVENLKKQGYRVIGPTVRDGAMVLDDLPSIDHLPVGWVDEQEGGTYRLHPESGRALFGVTNGPHSWKKFLFPSEVKLLSATGTSVEMQMEMPQEETPKFAFLGVRACELAAIRVQDAVLAEGPYRDPIYSSRREQALLICVKCTKSGGTCFCASMDTGPEPRDAFDLALTEMADAKHHQFIAEAGSERGQALLDELQAQEASGEQVAEARRRVERAAKQMGRRLNTDGLPTLLSSSFDHPQWEKVARRCLTCGNCTLSCPTCFCTTVEDKIDLTGRSAERWRTWDSCFTLDFSYIYSGSVRATPASRYRQWMTHKLSTWVDQFEMFGCVGCGRCITWCPVGIDITEEAAAIRQSRGAGARQQSTRGEAR